MLVTSVGVLIGRDTRGSSKIPFQEVENALYFDLGGGYIGVYTGSNSSNYIFMIYAHNYLYYAT